MRDIPMAEVTNGTTATSLESTAHIPIAQLTPLLTAPASRSLKAVVTLTWPYSSATGSVAFLLAEPDFRLRRTRGQVRVQFSGSSAKTVSKSGIASGDEVILCLDGVEFVQDEQTVSTPGRGVEFELRFTERLFLQFQQVDSQKVNLIDVDHPAIEQAATAPISIASPQHDDSPAVPTTNGSWARADLPKPPPDEFSSPAFIKRARTSYGSLFEADYDPFAEEDGTIRGKGRKRTRLSATWRYTSRSPTPEMEVPEESPNNTSPEPAIPSPVLMTDERSQTVGLEVDSAAETLADFARQAHNVGSSSYASLHGTTVSHARSQLNRRPHPTEIEMPPPMIQTQFQEETKASIANRDPSLSPRLRPIPSDSLPLVSPLVSKRLGGFAETSEQSSSFHSQFSAPTESTLPRTEGEPEDLYGASPVGRHGQQPANDLHSFQDPLSGFNGVENTTTDGHYLAEDQYGHWQGATAQLSHSASPYKGADDEDMQQDHLHVQSQEEEYFNHGFQLSQTDIQAIPQYPDLDEVMPGQSIASTWDPDSTIVKYPDLPKPNKNHENVISASSLPRSAAMSRSQSGQSQQSQAIDLTESSNEGEEEEELEDRRLQQTTHHEEYEGSMEEYDEEDEGKEEEKVPVVGNRQLPQTHAPMDEGDSQDEEQYYDEESEVDEQGNKYPPGFYPDHGEGFYDEEEEGSFDEADMDEGEPPARPQVRKEPEVIDLLSSDEEDGDEPAPKSAPPQTRVPQQHPDASDEEESEDVSDVDMEDDAVPDVANSGLHSTKPGVFTGQVEGEESEENPEESPEHDSDEAIERVEDLKDTEILRRNKGKEGYSDAESGDAGNEEDMDVESEHKAITVQENDDFKLGKKNRPPGNESQPPALETEVLVKTAANRVNEQLTRPSLRERPFNLDSTNNEPEDNENMDVDRSHPLDSAGQQNNMAVDSVVKTALDNVNEQLSKPPSQERPSLFSRMFNLDGANDELDMRFSSSTKTKSQSSPPATISEHEQASPIIESDPQKQGNGQLPTPDATQISDKIVSPETSFTSAKETQEASQKELGESRDKVPSHEEPKVPVVEIPAEPDAGIVEFEPTESAVTKQDIEVSSREESNVSGVEIPAESDAGVMEFEPTEAALTKPESGVAESKSVTAEIAEIAIDADDSKQVGDREDAGNEMEEPSSESELLKKIEHVSLPLQEPEYNTNSPRRSHRKVKSTVKAIDMKENARPVTPVKASEVTEPNSANSVGANRASPMVVIDERATPKGHDASIELALSSLESPSKQPYDLRKPPVADLKLRLSRALRTELSEFTALKVLRYHLNQKLDILAIATTTPPEPQRAKFGPRHYQITFNITDPSIAPSGVTEVQVFRPYKDALPTVKAGDGILLRNFKIVSVKNRGFGLQSEQTEASSWAVFKDGDETEVRGPPVEYGTGERNHVLAMKAWYGNLDSVAMAKINRANADKGVGTGAGGKTAGKAF